MNDYKNIIDKALKKYLPSPKNYPKSICAAIEYSVFPGGKRLRPILCLAASQIFNKNINKVLPTACAIELIHNYSLVHDDLPCMDNDDYRRGRLTTHRKFNEAIAVLTGDALIALAFEIIVKHTKISSDIVLKVVKELSEVVGIKGLITGQVKDIELNTGINEDELKAIYFYKTASLFRAAVRCAAILNNATNKALKTLTLFAEKFGLAYQILDDLKDIEKDKNKLTYPRMFGKDKSEEMILRLKKEALEILEYFGKRNNKLVEITTKILRI